MVPNGSKMTLTIRMNLRLSKWKKISVAIISTFQKRLHFRLQFHKRCNFTIVYISQASTISQSSTISSVTLERCHRGFACGSAIGWWILDFETERQSGAKKTIPNCMIDIVNHWRNSVEKGCDRYVSWSDDLGDYCREVRIAKMSTFLTKTALQLWTGISRTKTKI